jgi:hypothetical protein
LGTALQTHTDPWLTLASLIEIVLRRPLSPSAPTPERPNARTRGVSGGHAGATPNQTEATANGSPTDNNPTIQIPERGRAFRRRGSTGSSVHLAISARLLVLGMSGGIGFTEQICAAAMGP